MQKSVNDMDEQEFLACYRLEVVTKDYSLTGIKPDMHESAEIIREDGESLDLIVVHELIEMQKNEPDRFEKLLAEILEVR